MGKFENIPELGGTENYYEWRRQTEQLLLGQGVYNHISTGTNPFDYVKYASTCPCPLIPAAPTLAEQEAIKVWFKDDGLAKSIILRKINSSVLTLIPDDVSITAREVWNTLAELYDRSDVSLQFSLRAQISTYQMKGANDAEKYVALHTHANDRLARMGARPSDSDAIYALLRGLPKVGIWFVHGGASFSIGMASSGQHSRYTSESFCTRTTVHESVSYSAATTLSSMPLKPS